MCGLAGFSGHAPADPSKIKILLLENESRGSQSTGIYGKRLMKKPIPASKFIYDVNFDHIASNNFVIGHTRQPTSSNRLKEHAHPFMFGSRDSDFLVGAHNGSIFNEYELEQKIEGFTRCDVDSQSIYKAIYMTKDPHKFMMCEGHMALTFYYNGLVYLYRRDTRPLFLGKTREGYYWSSLKEGLKKLSIPEEKIYDLKPDRLIILDGSKIVDKVEMPQPRVVVDTHTTAYNWDNKLSPELKEELTGKKHIPVVHQTTGANNQVHTVKKEESRSETSGSTNSRITTEPAPLFRSQQIPQVPPVRIMSSSDMKAIGAPRLSGRNICLAANTKLTSREYSDFIRDQMAISNTGNMIHYNFFYKDKTVPFWMKDMNPVVKSDMCMFPQSAVKMEPCVTESIIVDIKFLFHNKRFNTINEAFRSNLYAFWQISDHTGLVTKEGFDSDAVAYGQIVNQRRAEEHGGYFRIEIPKPSLKLDSLDMTTLRIAVADVRCPGFMWESIIRLEKDSYYKFTAVMDIQVEEDFTHAVSEHAKGVEVKTIDLANTDDSGPIVTRFKRILESASLTLSKYPSVNVEQLVNSKIQRNLFKSHNVVKAYKEMLAKDEEKKNQVAIVNTKMELAGSTLVWD